MRVSGRLHERSCAPPAQPTGETPTGFVLAAATERAQAVTERTERINVSADAVRRRARRACRGDAGAPATRGTKPHPATVGGTARRRRGARRHPPGRSFDCGVAELDQWLRRPAGAAAAAGPAATYAVCRGPRVAGHQCRGHKPLPRPAGQERRPRRPRRRRRAQAMASSC
ncbi:MAG: DUF1778 domain-containing protein, partial [Acidimicrobiales bacterium]